MACMACTLQEAGYFNPAAVATTAAARGVGRSCRSSQSCVATYQRLAVDALGPGWHATAGGRDAGAPDGLAAAGQVSVSGSRFISGAQSKLAVDALVRNGPQGWHSLVAYWGGKPRWHTEVANLGGKPGWHTKVANLGGIPGWHTWVSYTIEGKTHLKVHTKCRCRCWWTDLNNHNHER